VASLREATPWWIKVAGKLVLSRLPVPYRAWRSLGIFRHGAMLSPDYARAVFQKHFERARPFLPESFRVLELGPGDSLATAILAAAEGSAETYLVDAGPFADHRIDAYRPLFESEGQKLAAARLDFEDIRAMMTALRAHYLTGGLESLRRLPSDSIHVTFSHAVLEHTPKDEFAETVRELFRLQAPGGFGSHQIDLQDHLGRSLNSLRFSPAVWESAAFRNAGFYTNRLRASQVLDVFRGAGYEVVSAQTEKWHGPPLGRGSLHSSLRSLSEDDLLTFSLDLVVRKRL